MYSPAFPGAPTVVSKLLSTPDRWRVYVENKRAKDADRLISDFGTFAEAEARYDAVCSDLPRRRRNQPYIVRHHYEPLSPMVIPDAPRGSFCGPPAVDVVDSRVGDRRVSFDLDLCSDYTDTGSASSCTDSDSSDSGWCKITPLHDD